MEAPHAPRPARLRSTPVAACGEGEGVVANADDCDDADPGEPVLVRDGESIEAAIEVARACVYVYAGSYAEDLDLLGKDLLVWGVDGAEATVVTGSGEGPVLSIRSGESARVAGFTTCACR